ncbi:MAG: hypothetical protein QOH66_2734 [Actinomycetota bacterium]|nr:hypothetical protein [Actinomycetota bacterium]
MAASVSGMDRDSGRPVAATTAANSRERPFLVVVGKRPEAADVIALYDAVGWGEADDYDEDSIRSALANTLCIIHATDPDGRLIGFARLFGDGIFHTSLAEIVVHPNWQRKGVGAALLAEACELCAGTSIFLETFRGQEPFFESCGFSVKSHMVVMSRRRQS